MADIILFAIWLIFGWMAIFGRMSRTAGQIAYYRYAGFPIFAGLATLLVLVFWPFAPHVMRTMAWILKQLLDNHDVDQ